MRTAYDFSPLYRSVIGFDRMADIIDSAMKSEGDRGYPPYDVEKTSDDSYRITLAAAGFAADELEVTTKPNLLIVTGHKAKEEDGSRTFLHRGIAARSFERKFEPGRPTGAPAARTARAIHDCRRPRPFGGRRRREKR